MSPLRLRVLGNRVLICPDLDDRAPEATPSGLVIAKSLAAAVTGSDPVLAWSRGTIVALGTPCHPLREEALDLASRLNKLSRAIGSDTNSGLALDAARLLSDLVRREPSVAIGDDVLFPHDVGQELVLHNQTYVIAEEKDLLAVVIPGDCRGK